MYLLKRSRRFKRDFKKVFSRKDFNKKSFFLIVEALRMGRRLPVQYRSHKLQGEFTGCMECHIQSDMLLIYIIDAKECVVFLLRIGSHSDLF